MLRKILLSSILILVVGCGGNSKSFKNGVYEGFIAKDPFKLIINNNKVELIDNTSYYSKVSNKKVSNKNENENDKDIVYYITDKNGFKLYLGLKQTNDNSIVVYNMPTVACRNSMLSYNAGFIDKEMLNSIIDIYSIDINKPSIFEKVEEK
ncbi:hypothetical protein [Brachyspira aalborgi]|uniref:hypothetical protein n=1 Tax=Brachyspira aalborgi TaxID=29522 RepID=UPI0026660187|nr:hypothetical protein [Brachyspira aalborgi]